MKILFAASENAWGGFFHLIRNELPEHSFEATGRFGFDSLRGVDILIPTMTPVPREALKSADRLRLIQQCGSGLEAVDLEAARALDIRVANVPTDISGNADSVAELGIFLLIGLARDFRGLATSLAGQRMGEPQGRGLGGMTVGLVGLGGIGRALVHRLKPFGVRCIGIKRRDPEQTKRELGLDWAGGPGDLPALLRRADAVMLCLPLSLESRSLLDAEAFSNMKPDAFLINLSRGGLVDRDALHGALASGKIAGVGLDVYWEEPPDPSDPIFGYNVLATPHVGGSTDRSMRGIVAAVAENIQRVEAGEEPMYRKES